jgi:hypothetical protein
MTPFGVLLALSAALVAGCSAASTPEMRVIEEAATALGGMTRIRGRQDALPRGRRRGLCPRPEPDTGERASEMEGRPGESQAHFH